MEALVFFIATREAVNKCYEELDTAESLDDEMSIVKKCDEIIVGLMNTAIIRGNIEDFKFLWMNWSPDLCMETMVELIITECGGNPSEFLKFLKHEGKFIEYGIVY